jgi:Rod binding domain-containing protein
VSSTGMVTPAVSLSEVRGKQAADNLKSTGSANTAKIQKSAREFEAVLLSHWLEQAEQSFASVPGSNADADSDPGKDQFHAIAMQAVGTALTGGHGGLGIAAMVAKQLEARVSHPADPGKPLTIKDLKAAPITIKPLVSPQVAK